MSSRDRTNGKHAMADDTLDSRQDETERYRRAADDALQQLNWCIGYLHGIRKAHIARVLAQNRSVIRTNLLHRAAEPVPTAHTDE
jgi:hypothetical protein